MAWVTTLGPDEAQGDYRLTLSAGCGIEQLHGPEPGVIEPEADVLAEDHQLGYRMTAEERPLVWIGNGLAEFGITPGAELTEADHDVARALLDGADPRTGEQLVDPKLEYAPIAKLPAIPFLAALTAAGIERGQQGRPAGLADLVGSKKAVARVERMMRGVDRQGEAHTVPIDDLERLAARAGIELEQVFPAGKLQAARNNRHARVRIGNRGYDLTLDLPKSLSVLYGLADGDLAAGIEAIYTAAVYETIAAVETWTGYGMRGHHGDGRQATRIDTSGLMGWVMWHTVARPVDGQAPDPHLHPHIVLANMARGVDGKWSTFGAGGQDLHRHAHAADALVKARIRRELTRVYGTEWARNPATGAWEITAVPPALREHFSKRGAQVKALFAELGLDYEAASTAERKYRSATSKEAKQRRVGPVDLRTDWRAQAAQQGTPAGAVIDAAIRPGQSLPAQPSIEEIAAQIFDPEHGLTAHRKTVTRADVLAAVMDAIPGGVAGLTEAEQLTDAVLALEAHAAPLPSAPPHLSNGARYTTRDILAAEQTNLAAARAGYGRTFAIVEPSIAEMALAAFCAERGYDLSGEQAAVLDRLVGAGHGVDAVVGTAGAGKTTLMSAARTAWQTGGYTVAGAATAAVAAQNLQAESGIASATIASWLHSITHGGRAGRRGLDGVDVLVVDEAAMVDDRQLAVLLTHARATGTKVVLIGDPKQLKAVGVGGSFAGIWRQVDGPALTENRRQSDPIERRALALWRDEHRDDALRTWTAGGRVHAGRDREDTLAALVADWAHLRTGRFTDAHTELAELLVLAGTNSEVDVINTTTRAIRRAAGELTGPDVAYRTPRGILALAVGDHVRVRGNDYRSRRPGAAPGTVDVLNGYRGVITAIDDHRNVRVAWRRQAADGPVIEAEWITPAQIAAGDLSHGTAMTVAAAQGLTADVALVYGLGLDPNTLYPAMSRDRHQAHLYLPRNLLEDDVDRARHGEAETPEQELARAIDAYARTLRGDRADRLVLTELGREPDPIATRVSDQAAAAAEHWSRRPYGDRTTTELARLRDAYTRAERRLAAKEHRTAALQTEASAGNGPQALKLIERRDAVAAAAAIETQINTVRAELAGHQTDAGAARQRLDDLERQTRRGRLALRRDGTSREQVRTDLSATRRALSTALDAEHGARARLADLAAQARSTYEQRDPASGPGPRWEEGAATTEHEDLTSNWETHLAAAIRADHDSAAARAATTADLGLLDHTRATTTDQARTELAAVRAELNLRTALPPDRARAEDRQRRTARRNEQVERQQAQRGPGYGQPHQPYSGIRRGDGPHRSL
ncbi:MobF family relaxase [Actinoallomurus oryzae]|uniref:MobF family relaxase n=1 Tax=Actinoallomurus oryzae TaxID=502180 RepID=UPI0031E9E9CB